MADLNQTTQFNRLSQTLVGAGRSALEIFRQQANALTSSGQNGAQNKTVVTSAEDFNFSAFLNDYKQNQLDQGEQPFSSNQVARGLDFSPVTTNTALSERALPSEPRVRDQGRDSDSGFAATREPAAERPQARPQQENERPEAVEPETATARPVERESEQSAEPARADEQNTSDAPDVTAAREPARATSDSDEPSAPSEAPANTADNQAAATNSDADTPTQQDTSGNETQTQSTQEAKPQSDSAASEQATVAQNSNTAAATASDKAATQSALTGLNASVQNLVADIETVSANVKNVNVNTAQLDAARTAGVETTEATGAETARTSGLESTVTKTSETVTAATTKAATNQTDAGKVVSDRQSEAVETVEFDGTEVELSDDLLSDLAPEKLESSKSKEGEAAATLLSRPTAGQATQASLTQTQVVEDTASKGNVAAVSTGKQAANTQATATADLAKNADANLAADTSVEENRPVQQQNILQTVGQESNLDSDQIVANTPLAREAVAARSTLRTDLPLSLASGRDGGLGSGLGGVPGQGTGATSTVTSTANTAGVNSAAAKAASSLQSANQGASQSSGQANGQSALQSAQRMDGGLRMDSLSQLNSRFDANMTDTMFRGMQQAGSEAARAAIGPTSGFSGGEAALPTGPAQAPSATATEAQLSQNLTATQRYQNAMQALGEQMSLQIQRGLSNGNDRLNISLNQNDLGRVDIKMEFGSDGRLSAIITADRADTLEQLRQDSRSLVQILQDSGLQADSQSLNYNLRDQNGDNNEAKKKFATAQNANGVTGDAFDDSGVPMYARVAQGQGGLDIHV